MSRNPESNNVPTDQRHRFQMSRMWIEVKLTNGLDEPMEGERCILYPKTGDPVECTLDNQGFLREESLPSGKVVIEFPDLAEVCLVDAGKQIEGPSRDIRLERGDFEQQPSEIVDLGSYNLDADEDNDYDEEFDDEDDDEEEDEDTTLEPDIGESFETEVKTTSGRGWTDLHLVPVDVKVEDVPTYKTATYEAHTGQKYHFAVLMCIAVEVHSTRVVDEAEPLGFRLATPSGEELLEDEVDDWFIFHDAVGIGDYQLTIAGETLWVPSVARATEAVVLSLDDLLDQGQEDSVGA